MSVHAAPTAVTACRGEWPGRWASEPRALDFAALRSADHLRIVTVRDAAVVSQTSDPTHVSAAAEFAIARQKEWVEVFPGPLAPTLVLEFTRSDLDVGFYGIADDYITWGGLSRRVLRRDIDTLRSQLSRALETDVSDEDLERRRRSRCRSRNGIGNARRRGLWPDDGDRLLPVNRSGEHEHDEDRRNGGTSEVPEPAMWTHASTLGSRAWGVLTGILNFASVAPEFV